MEIEAFFFNFFNDYFVHPIMRFHGTCPLKKEISCDVTRDPLVTYAVVGRFVEDLLS